MPDCNWLDSHRGNSFHTLGTDVLSIFCCWLSTGASLGAVVTCVVTRCESPAEPRISSSVAAVAWTRWAVVSCSEVEQLGQQSQQVCLLFLTITVMATDKNVTSHFICHMSVGLLELRIEGKQRPITGYDNNFFSHLPCRASRWIFYLPEWQN